MRIYGHHSNRQLLAQLHSQERIPHALLFIGKEGIGKSLVAREFFTLINQNTPHIEHCFQQGSDNHPDFIYYQPEGRFIKLAQIHDIQERLSRKNIFATKRVLLICDVDSMNQEAANAFLKTLEEPPAETLFILTCKDENLVFETLVSRCQRLWFAGLSPTDLKSVYQHSLKSPEEKLPFLLRHSHGQVRLSLLSHCEALQGMESAVLGLLSRLPRTELGAEFDYLAEVLQKKQSLHLGEYLLEFCLLWAQSLLHYASAPTSTASSISDIGADWSESQRKQTNTLPSAALDLIIDGCWELECALQAHNSALMAFECFFLRVNAILKKYSMITGTS